MKRSVAFLVLLLVALLLVGPTPAADEVEVKVVNYDGMAKIVDGLKGKVVVVDFWADT
jgi:hypothetical protein